MGTPLCARRDEAAVVAALDSHVLALIELLPNVYGGNSEACRQAVLELGVVANAGASRGAVACKRAVLLYALSAEREACEHWKQSSSAALAQDLQSRVLPFIVPRFFKNCCRAPEAFAMLAIVLAEMWEGEDLGNFAATHHD